MKNWMLGSAVAVALVWSGVSSAAGKQDFTLINQTGYEIDQVYVSSAATDEWEEDVLGQDTLDDRERVNIHFARGTRGCNYDLKVVYTDDEEAVWEDINLCKVSSITIHWNRKTGETSATLD